MAKVSLIKLLSQVYPDRRDRYGFTILSNSWAVRAIKRGDCDGAKLLIDTKALDALLAAQVVLKPKVVSGRQDEYVFLVQKRIRPAVVPSEWSPTMFADAAKLILDAEKALCYKDMTVDDPHPWNVLFDEGRPYIVDMGAFNIEGTGLHHPTQMETKIWPAASVFNAFFLNAVALAAAGRGHYIRRMLTDWNPFPGSDTALLLFKSPAALLLFLQIRFRMFVFNLAWRTTKPLAPSSLKRKLKLAYLDTISRYIERMRARIVQRMSNDDTLSVDTSVRPDVIKSFMDQHSSRRLILFGANARMTAGILNGSRSARTLVVSPDEELIDVLYRSALTQLTVAVMDLRSPTPGTGPGNRWILPATERFKTEVGVFFFDLEELVIEKCLTVSELVQAARDMSDICGLIVFKKLTDEISILGRNYGQTSDCVLMACLEDNLEVFDVLNNNNREMIVSFSCGKKKQPPHDN
ncbi:hypothetical protein LSUCC0387_05455 [Rhodobacterales bacterium LSUCC0387]|nr:hypothetical protein [Rhodobacterales bacterium LSUCC0387]